MNFDDLTIYLDNLTEELGKHRDPLAFIQAVKSAGYMLIFEHWRIYLADSYGDPLPDDEASRVWDKLAESIPYV